ncbi:hypothetical protein [Polyangium aurulentum]|uniref:hypothetical protein n=1 Tax=Polyangium aurulentum TaxID=2567896 RepID=UPI0010ADE381|nr:hypothetical protein [Polyangium aurulentum]UQA59718.1 hypothetical protein E8A73_004215 [Polyangium aurulentum]
MRIALLGMGIGVLVAAAVGCTWETGDPDVGGAAAGDAGAPDLSPACARACGALVAGGCTAQTTQACEATCTEWAKSWPQCTAELGAYLDCEAFSGQCNASACVEKFAQWQICTNAGCTSESCGAPCTCVAECKGALHEISCVPAGDKVTCTCSRAGTVVGTCEDKGTSCGVATTCCRGVFGL